MAADQSVGQRASAAVLVPDSEVPRAVASLALHCLVVLPT